MFTTKTLALLTGAALFGSGAVASANAAERTVQYS